MSPLADDDPEKIMRYAEAYRARLEARIDADLHFADGTIIRPPEWLREIRAENLWRRTTGGIVPPEWGIDEIITALVVRAFGQPVRPAIEGDEI